MGRGAVIGGIVAALGAAGAFVAYGAHSTSAQLRNDLTAVGYQGVTQTSSFSSKATTTLHGCTIGLESEKGKPRTVDKRQVHPFTVNAVSTDGKTWTVLNVGNAAPTPAEVTKYMQHHKGEDAFKKCYKPTK